MPEGLYSVLEQSSTSLGKWKTGFGWWDRWLEFVLRANASDKQDVAEVRAGATIAWVRGDMAGSERQRFSRIMGLPGIACGDIKAGNEAEGETGLEGLQKSYDGECL